MFLHKQVSSIVAIKVLEGRGARRDQIIYARRDLTMCWRWTSMNTETQSVGEE